MLCWLGGLCVLLLVGRVVQVVGTLRRERRRKILVGAGSGGGRVGERGGERGGEEGVSVCVVLGSGGHTSEMLNMMGAVDRNKYRRRTYVVANTDAQSGIKARVADPEGEVVVVPRAREVGQSWVTSVATTAYAFFHALWVVWVKIQPDALVVNGPGTCVPFALAALAARILCLPNQPRIVFVESMCRVKSLSLSGRILYPIADRFVVQWQHLQTQYPEAEYLGLM